MHVIDYYIAPFGTDVIEFPDVTLPPWIHVGAMVLPTQHPHGEFPMGTVYAVGAMVRNYSITTRRAQETT